MIARCLIHVAGPRGAGKTTFVESLVRSLDALFLVARCVRDDSLTESVELAPTADPELTRYREAGAGGVARFAFPESEWDSDSFFTTDLMTQYSEAVVIEGDNPLGFADLEVFVAPPPRRGRLFVRRKRDRAAEERARADAYERLLEEPAGAVELLRQMVGDAIAELAQARPEMLEEFRTTLRAGIAKVRRSRPPKPTEHWSIADGYAGIEMAQLVVINAHGDAGRERGVRLAEDVVRLRKDDTLFNDILGARGNRIPITVVTANLVQPKDAARKKALGRVKRALQRMAR